MQPITVWIFGQLREFGTSIDVIAPASFISLVIPLVRVLRVPALLRAGPAGGLGEVVMHVAVVGSGLAGFAAYQTLRRGGLAPEEIAVFGTQDDPAGAFARRAAAIRQRRMRSESDGHCLPATFPGLAVRSALRGARPRRSSPRRSTATTRR